MNLDLCKKCRRWIEFVSLLWGSDDCAAGKMVFSCSISDLRNAGICFKEESLKRLVDTLDGKRYCDSHDEKWMDVISNFNDEYKELENEMKAKHATKECEFYVEQTLGDLNK